MGGLLTKSSAAGAKDLSETSTPTLVRAYTLGGTLLMSEVLPVGFKRSTTAL